jgi:Ca2+-binding EF-hand superfamily protein
MNFNLYDRRNTGGYINLEESEELLLSIGQPVEADELQELYDELKDVSKGGINFENIKLIIAKKIRDKDNGVQLKVAFSLIAEACTPPGMKLNPSDPKVHTEMFKEMLMSMGNKLTEE